MATTQGTKKQYRRTILSEKTGLPFDFTGGTATFRYRYDDGNSAETSSLDNTLDTTGVVEVSITHSSSGVFEWEMYGTDANGNPWRIPREVDIVNPAITAPP